MTGGVAAGKEPLRPALNKAENKAESAGLNRCRRAEQGGI